MFGKKKKFMIIVSQRNGEEYIIKNSNDEYILLNFKEMSDVSNYDCDAELETNLKISNSNDKYVIMNETNNSIILTEQEFRNLVSYVDENFAYKLTDLALAELKEKGMIKN